jgi:hypothetical protein
VTDSGHGPSTPIDGVDLTRLLGNLAELVRVLADVTTLDEVLEIAGEYVRAGLRCVSLSRCLALSRVPPRCGP